MSRARHLDSRANRRRELSGLLVHDATSLFLAVAAATAVRFRDFSQSVVFEGREFSITFLQLGLLLIPVFMAFLAMGRLYDTSQLFWGGAEFTRVAQGLSMGLVGLVLVTYVLKLPGLSRGWTLLLWGFGIVFVSAGRLLLRVILRNLRRRGRLTKRTLVVGWNAEVERLTEVLFSDPANGLVPAGSIASSQTASDKGGRYGGRLDCLGDATHVRETVLDLGIDVVVVGATAFDYRVLSDVLVQLSDLDIELHLSSGLFGVLTNRVMIRELSGVPVMSVRGLLPSAWKRGLKRSFDIIVAATIMLLGVPLWTAVVLAIKLTSPGPIFYRQTRVGCRGVPLEMYKFRSMYVDADERFEQLRLENEASGPLFKMRDDPRVTPLGMWLRRYSIDEIPQLINVVKGEMSLVGPRPPLPHETEDYDAHHWRRMEVLPGMTGLWQVSGRSDLSFDEMVRLDVFYIENWSVGFDLSLMLRTVPAVLFSRGAY